MKPSTVIIAAAIALGLGAAIMVGFGGGGTGADPSDAQQVALGETVYRTHCGSCHGANLEGQPNWRARNPDGTLPAPPHDETGHTWHHPDQVLFDYTKRGGQALAPPGFRSAMPGFAETLGDRDIWAVLAYLKSRWPDAIRERQRQIDARGR